MSGLVVRRSSAFRRLRRLHGHNPHAVLLAFNRTSTLLFSTTIITVSSSRIVCIFALHGSDLCLEAYQKPPHQDALSGRCGFFGNLAPGPGE